MGTKIAKYRLGGTLNLALLHINHLIQWVFYFTIYFCCYMARPFGWPRSGTPKPKNGLWVSVFGGREKFELHGSDSTRSTRIFPDPKKQTLLFASTTFSITASTNRWRHVISCQIDLMLSRSTCVHVIGVRDVTQFTQTRFLARPNLYFLDTKLPTRTMARTIKGYASTQNRVAWTHGL